MKIIYGAVIFLGIFCVSFAYGFSNHPDATGSETLKNRDKPSDHFTKPIILTLAQADKNATDDQKPLYHFGIPPYQRGQRVDEIRDQYKPFLIWLGQQVGCRFDFIGGETYDEMIRMVVNGEVHLAGLAPVSYVVAKQQNPKIKLLVTELRLDEEKKDLVDYYNAYILTLKKRQDIRTLMDLKGGKFAFVNPNSTSGYVYPKALMREKGVNPDSFFSKIYFLGTHPRVTDAIAGGSVDAGATWSFNLNRATKKHGDKFNVISKMQIPNLTIVAHPSLPHHISLKIQEVLLTIDPSLLENIPPEGFVVRPDSFYDEVRLLVEESQR